MIREFKLHDPEFDEGLRQLLGEQPPEPPPANGNAEPTPDPLDIPPYLKIENRGKPAPEPAREPAAARAVPPPAPAPAENGHDQAPPLADPEPDRPEDLDVEVEEPAIETPEEAAERVKRQAIMRALAGVRTATDQAEPGDKLRAFEMVAAGAIKLARGEMPVGDVTAALHDVAIQLDLIAEHGDDDVTRAIARAINRADRKPDPPEPPPPTGESDYYGATPARTNGAGEPASASAPLFDPWETYIVPLFPLDVLPEIVQRFVETQSRIIGCDPAALAMCALANFSGAIDHRFAIKMLRHGDWYAPPRLWIVLVGDVSRRKTPVMNAATCRLIKIDNAAWRVWERDAKEALKANPKAEEPPKPACLWSADLTIEACGETLGQQDRGVLIKRDELAGWIGSMERYHSAKGLSADRAFWLQAYDGGPFKTGRIRRGTVRIENLSASILGGIQPGLLKEVQHLTADGLLQRFLPVMMRATVLPSDEPSDDAAEAYGNLTATLVNAKPATVIMTDAAREAATEIRTRLHYLEQESSGLALGFQGFVGKLPGILGSLALILHMLDEPLYGGAYPVELDTVQRAGRLIDKFLIPHAIEFYSLIETGRPDSDRLRKIASYVLTSGKQRLVVSDLTQNVAFLKGSGPDEVNKAVAPLVAGGWLTPEDGLIAKAWKVNPAVHAQLAHRRAEEEQRKAELAKLMKARFNPQD